ncbi:MAG: IS1182 family transposase [Alphaproteobacteria bacterium]|nr:IS1182 family transposase [Alphaproteobacteria bacterium]
MRSSRLLEREAGRNLEVIWLLRGQRPGYRTIAKFRAENAVALRAANRDFVRLLGRLALLGGDLVAIDGAFFDGNASKSSVVTARRLGERLAALDRDIDAYAEALAASDASEAAEPAVGSVDPGAAMAALLARRAETAATLAQLEASGETQHCRTDADARLLSKSGQSLCGYNVQIAVDAAHKLIVASEVVNDGNDTGQLHALASAAKAVLAAETLRVVADVGYHNGETLRACEADGIEAFVAVPERARQLPAEGRFGLASFIYDAVEDIYRCPAGESLHPSPTRRLDATGKWRIRYTSRKARCRLCPMRASCLSPKRDRREVERWEHEDVIERHRARMAADIAAAVLRQRKALAEHPFGTLKCRAGYRHFLVRGFAKVRGEWGLMALCYNLTRVINIIGLPRFIAWIARLLVLAATILSPTRLCIPTTNLPKRQTAKKTPSGYPTRSTTSKPPQLRVLAQSRSASASTRRHHAPRPKHDVYSVT